MRSQTRTESRSARSFTTILKNAAEVALEAGNSPRMIFELYRELATEAEANAWFAVRRDKPSVEFLEAA